ncbi:hypothetical protein AURDEDRAFT_172148 [Auricularia subglabra TFB-10046 SS5]|nr:hypothetical protein AURDEDRAFT_172148 [Auricularia subglabra TFB-10046 SS5]
MSQAAHLEALARLFNSPAVIGAQMLYNFFLLSGTLLLLVVLGACAASDIPAARNAALINLLMGLVLMSSAGLLLAFSGHGRTPHPPEIFSRGAFIIAKLVVTLPGKHQIPRLLRVAISALPGCAFLAYVLALATCAFSDGPRLRVQRGVLLCRFTESPWFLSVRITNITGIAFDYHSK